MEPSTLSWTYFESPMLMKSVIYLTFMPIGEIKKYQITCISTCTNNTTGLEKCHPGQVDFPAGPIIFHSFLPEGERGWTSYLPTKIKVNKKVKQVLPTGTIKILELLAIRASQNSKKSLFFQSHVQDKAFFFSISSPISQRIQMKETVADAFISRFQLKPDELQALKGTRNGPISEVKKLMLELKCLPFLHVILFRPKWQCEALQ